MARGPAKRTVAIVLDTTKLAERDLIVTLLAEDGTLECAVAKGARKGGSRFGAACELYRISDVLLAPGRNLSVMADARLVEGSPILPRDFEVLSACAAIAECVKAASVEGEGEGVVFSLTARALEILAQPLDLAHLKLIVSAFAFKLTAMLGWRVELDFCVGCGSADVRWFDAMSGGALCSDCAAKVEAAELLGDHRRSWIRALLLCPLAELARAPVAPDDAAWMAHLALAWTRAQLEVGLKSFAFFANLSSQAIG